MPVFLAAIPAALAASAGAVATAAGATATGAALTTAAGSIMSAGLTATGLGSLAAGGAAVSGTAATGATTVAAGSVIPAAAGSAAIDFAATGAAAASTAVPEIAAAAGASAVLSPAAVSSAMTVGNVIGQGVGLPTIAAVGSAGLGVYQNMASAEQQRAIIAQQAEAEAKQTHAQQAAYRGRVQQVLSMNMASAAQRGVLPGGSSAALMKSNLEGGQIDVGNMSADLRSRLGMFQAVRRNARTRGLAGSAGSLLDLYGAVG